MEINFKNLLKDLFPSITESTQEEIKKAIAQFGLNPQLLYQSINKNVIYQGDIITEIQFVTLIRSNLYRKKTLKGMLISNTCDYENRDTILIAPVYSFKHIKRKYKGASFIDSLKKNLIYDKFYLPGYIPNNDAVVDFSGINSVKKDFLVSSINNKEIDRINSFSQMGFYYFITKLTVYFLRRESNEIIREKHNVIN